MTAMKLPLLIPVENQVRELDPKLLLACVAARRGFPSVIGPRREMHLRLTAFPRSIYLSKSTTNASVKVFKILRNLGHEIAAWDEEALVHPPPEIYFSRRLSAAALRYVSHLFAWGQENEDLWRQYPGLPAGLMIHKTGNPRGDLLRPEMHPFYEKESDEIYRMYGDFILVNTNFNHVNGFVPILNLFQPVSRPGDEPKFGRAAKGMTREYAEGLRVHKQTAFDHFKKLIPELARAFADYTIVVRPHPTENQEVYHGIAAQCDRVKVTNEGNVVPWLLAARVLVHNCCTTGVEAYTMRVPAVTYQATVIEEYDYGFYRLPNRLSYQCFDFEELCETVHKILAGKLGAANGEDRKALIDHYLTAREGPLACERMVDVLDKMFEDRSKLPVPDLSRRIKGGIMATRRRLMKRLKAHLPWYSHNSPEFQRHRYPAISHEQICERAARFQSVLGDSTGIKVEQIFDQFYRISA